MNTIIVTVHAHTTAVAGQEAGSPSTAGDGGQDLTTTTVTVDVGEPASNTTTTRPPQVDPQPRPHDPGHTKTTTTAVPVTLPPTGAHPAATATGGLFLVTAGIAAVLLARRPRTERHHNR